MTVARTSHTLQTIKTNNSKESILTTENPSAKTRQWQSRATAMLKPSASVTTKPLATAQAASKPEVEIPEVVIAQLCTLAGCPNLISTFISEGKTPAEVRAVLLADRGTAKPWSEVIAGLEKTGGK